MTRYGRAISNKIVRGRCVGQYYVLTAPNGAIAHYFDTEADRDSGDLTRAIPLPERLRRERATPRCPHTRTRDGGGMYVDPTVCCLQCGAIRKWSSTTWSDGSPA